MKLIGLAELVIFGLIVLALSVPHDHKNNFKGENLIYGQIIRDARYVVDEDKTSLITFYPDTNSVVNADNFQISCQRNASVEGMVLNGYYWGKRIETIQFLPVRVDDIFPNLIFYRAHHCAVESVTKKNFKNLGKLLLLSLVESDIKALDEDSFDDLTSLKSLDLFGNKIETLPEKLFRHLRELKFIELRGNPIAALNDQHFKNNKQLEFISLGQCRIKFLSPAMLDRIKALRSVNLSGNVCIDKQHGRFVFYVLQIRNGVITGVLQN